MYLVKRILVFTFVIITVNTAYSQKKECRYYSYYLTNSIVKNFPKDFLRDTTLYIYVDSNIVNGLTVYTDSVKVDIFVNNEDYLFMFGDFNMVLRNDEPLLYKIYYPIPLIDNPLFKKAVYRNDCAGVLSHMGHRLYSQQKVGTPKGYFILSADEKYIKYAFLTETNGELYTKYDPLNKDNGGTVTTMKRKKFNSWITQELDKNEVISITQIGNVYIVKSFSR